MNIFLGYLSLFSTGATKSGEWRGANRGGRRQCGHRVERMILSPEKDDGVWLERGTKSKAIALPSKMLEHNLKVSQNETG